LLWHCRNTYKLNGFYEQITGTLNNITLSTLSAQWAKPTKIIWNNLPYKNVCREILKAVYKKKETKDFKI